MTIPPGDPTAGRSGDDRFDLALRLLIRRFERARARYGDAHPHTLTECRLVTDLCLVIGRFGVARTYLEIALRLAEHGDEGSTVEIAGDLGHALLDLGEPELAAPHLRRQLEFLELQDAEGLATLMPRNSLAIALADTGRHKEARDLLGVNLALSIRLLGAQHRFTMTTRNNLASLDDDDEEP